MLLTSNIEALKDYIKEKHPKDICKIYQLMWGNGLPIIDKLNGREFFSADVNGYSTCNIVNRKYI